MTGNISPGIEINNSYPSYNQGVSKVGLDLINRADNRAKKIFGTAENKDYSEEDFYRLDDLDATVHPSSLPFALLSPITNQNISPQKPHLNEGKGDSFRSPARVSSVESKVNDDIDKRADSLAKKYFDERRSKSNREKRVLSKIEMPVNSSDWSSSSSSSSPMTSPQKIKNLGPAHFPTMQPKEFKIDSLPYLMTTEVGQLAALEKLRQIPTVENGLYLGFAFEFNYQILAERPAKLAWICDINKRMHKLYQFIALTIIHTDRLAFIEALKKEFKNEEKFYFGNYLDQELDPGENVVQHYLSQEFSWLFSEEKFLRIKTLYLNGQIHHVNLDLAGDPQFFADLKLWAKENGFLFDIVYVANIPEWFIRGNPTSVVKMKTNLLKIMSPSTIFIDAKEKEWETGAPEIRLTTGICKSASFPNFYPARRKGIRPDLPLSLSDPSLNLQPDFS